MMRITVNVKTSSNKNCVEKISDHYFLVHIKAPPRKGKANLAIIKLLRKHFDRPVNLVSGHASNTKIFNVEE